MTNMRLIGAVAISTISLMAVMWYLRRKKPPKRRPNKVNKSENVSPKETRNSLRHISSQPLIAESVDESSLCVQDVAESTLLTENKVNKSYSKEEEVDREEEMIIQEVAHLNNSKYGNFSLRDGNSLVGSSEKLHKDKNLDSFHGSHKTENFSIPQDDIIIAEATNNLNKSSFDTVNKKTSANNTANQNLNFTAEVNETMNSESMSVLNEAMTASRMGDVSFVNKLENESKEKLEQETVYVENESRETNEQELNDQDALSVSTMVPLLESTNLDVTCSQPRDGDVNSNDDIKPETSIKLESSSCESSQGSSKDDKLSHSNKKDSLVETNSNKRNRNDSNCSSQSAGHIEDRISETSSDRTASPFKERNSVSPSKDSQHGIVENGIQNSDTSNCDSGSVDSDKGSNGHVIENKRNVKLTYRCNFPTELCGRLIGKFGKNINYIKEKTGANVALNTNPFTPAFQLCSIDGTQRQIDSALNMISKRFPEVDLRPVDIPTLSDPSPNPVIMPEIMQLGLPEGVSVDVVVSSIVDAGHIFLQQPTHPSFPSLERLNQFMNACYMQDCTVPQLPRPLEVGVICAAPIMDGWYRAQVTAVYEGPDECDIKYVDYGGFSRVSGAVLRQIRSDFMTLPFQGIECYMANITPLQDEEYFSSEAAAVLEELTQGKLLQAQVVGRNEDGIAYCHIYQINGDKVTFVNRELVNRGVVRWIEILS